MKKTTKDLMTFAERQMRDNDIKYWQEEEQGHTTTARGSHTLSQVNLIEHRNSLV